MFNPFKKKDPQSVPLQAQPQGQPMPQTKTKKLKQKDWDQVKDAIKNIEGATQQLTNSTIGLLQIESDQKRFYQLHKDKQNVISKLVRKLYKKYKTNPQTSQLNYIDGTITYSE